MFVLLLVLRMLLDTYSTRGFGDSGSCFRSCFHSLTIRIRPLGCRHAVALPRACLALLAGGRESFLSTWHAQCVCRLATSVTLLPLADFRLINLAMSFALPLINLASSPTSSNVWLPPLTALPLTSERERESGGGEKRRDSPGQQ